MIKPQNTGMKTNGGIMNKHSHPNLFHFHLPLASMICEIKNPMKYKDNGTKDTNMQTKNTNPDMK